MPSPDRRIHHRRRWSYHEGIGKPDASWDDAVHVAEAVYDDDLPGLGIVSYRHGQALMTGEFMQDAEGGLLAAIDAIDEALDER